MNRNNWDKIETVLSGTSSKLRLGNANAETDSGIPLALFPGSFNPLHDGHRKIHRLAVQRLESPVHFELSIRNVDKPAMPQAEIMRRVSQFPASETVWVTNAPTFAEKADLFPKVCFLVGADTIQRIADPKYYQGQVNRRDSAIDGFAERECRFMVFGRLIGCQFCELHDLDIPDSLRAICSGLTEREFRSDISSTTLRQYKNNSDQARDG